MSMFGDNGDNEIVPLLSDEDVLDKRSEYTQKRHDGKRVIAWVTGVSGCGRREYVKLQQQLTRANGEHFEVLDGAYFMRKTVKDSGMSMNWDNILDVRMDTLQDIRRKAYREMADIIRDNGDVDFAVLSHGVFDWHNMVIPGYDPSTFEGDMKPDICINVMDNEEFVSQELNRRTQWKDQGMTPERAMRWLSEEFNETKNMADRVGVPWYVITRYMAPTTMYMLLYHPERPWVYYAQQMTHADDDAYDEADALFCKLVRMFAVTNPKGYEILGYGMNDSTCYFTDHRDTQGFVQQNDMTIAFHQNADGYNRRLRDFADRHGLEPEAAEELMALAGRGPAPSAGVMAELSDARGSGKDTYTIWPSDYFSPFIRSKSKRIFKTPDECMEFLVEEYGPPLGIQIPKHVMDDAFCPHGRKRILPPNAYSL